MAAVAAMVMLIAWAGLNGAPAAPPAMMIAALSTATATPPIDTSLPEIIVPTARPSASPTSTASPTPFVTSTPLATPTPTAPNVAFIVGHRGNDSGAICENNQYDGLYEVTVTSDVAARLEATLLEAGYAVTLLDEFDPRLDGLTADMLLSLHVDSCVDWKGATGYKASRSSDSSIPEIEDRLIACIDEHYPAATGLGYHPTSITQHMTDYHAFRQVAPDTPAAIIELGFLYNDHELLTARQADIVEGLRRSVDCFFGRE